MPQSDGLDALQQNFRGVNRTKYDVQQATAWWRMKDDARLEQLGVDTVMAGLRVHASERRPPAPREVRPNIDTTDPFAGLK